MAGRGHARRARSRPVRDAGCLADQRQPALGERKQVAAVGDVPPPELRQLRDRGRTALSLGASVDDLGAVRPLTQLPATDARAAVLAAERAAADRASHLLTQPPP